jgi:hypothetical protein
MISLPIPFILAKGAGPDMSISFPACSSALYGGNSRELPVQSGLAIRHDEAAAPSLCVVKTSHKPTQTLF